MSYVIVGGTNVGVGQMSGGTNVGRTNVGRTNVGGTCVGRTKVAPPTNSIHIYLLNASHICLFLQIVSKERSD
jgi:hypothetical protein